MGILSSWFGEKQQDAEELLQDAGLFLDTLEVQLYQERNLKAALKQYRKNTRFDALFGEGGALEDRFLQIGFDLCSGMRKQNGRDVLPAPEMLTPLRHETQQILWDDSLRSLEDLCLQADFLGTGLIWLTTSEAEAQVDPLAAVDVLYCFAAEPSTALAIYNGDLPLVMRKPFLRRAADNKLDPDLQLEDLGQDLVDFAQNSALDVYEFYGR